MKIGYTILVSNNDLLNNVKCENVSSFFFKDINLFGVTT